MVKEIVLMQDGSQQEADVIQILSLEVKYGALDAATKTKVNVKTKDSNVDVSMGALILYVLKHQVKGVDTGKIDAVQGEHLFEKYFGKYFADDTNEEGKEVIVEGDANNSPICEKGSNEQTKLPENNTN